MINPNYKLKKSPLATLVSSQGFLTPDGEFKDLKKGKSRGILKPGCLPYKV